MSIIADALKKVEKKREPVVVSKTPSYTQAQTPQPQINITHVTQHKVSYLFVGIMVAAVVFMGLLFTKFSHSKPSYQLAEDTSADPATQAQAQKLQPKPIITPEPTQATFANSNFPILKKLVNDSNFRVSGIMYDENDPAAIINNQIVREGESIGEATVERIERDQVKISYEGKEFTLKVR